MTLPAKATPNDEEEEIAVELTAPSKSTPEPSAPEEDEEDLEAAEANDAVSELGGDIDPALLDRLFPASFYDPKTNMVMVDPVVDANGDSCEKPKDSDTGADTENTTTTDPHYYPNRALRSIIQRETQRNLPRNSLLGSLRRLDDSARKTWNQMVDKSALAVTEYRPLPDSFYCPITQELMVDPVIAPDGNTFEREAILNWIRANGTNPVTRQPLRIATLRRNNNLYQLIQEEKNRASPNRHPSIRRWIEEGGTSTLSRRTLDSEDWAEVDLPDTATSTTPLNYAQIAEARRRRGQQERSWTILFLFTILVILLFVPSNLTFFALSIALITLTCCKSAQQRRLLAQQQAEIEAATGGNSNNNESG